MLHGEELHELDGVECSYGKPPCDKEISTRVLFEYVRMNPDSSSTPVIHKQALMRTVFII